MLISILTNLKVHSINLSMSNAVRWIYIMQSQVSPDCCKTSQYLYKSTKVFHSYVNRFLNVYEDIYHKFVTSCATIRHMKNLQKYIHKLWMYMYLCNKRTFSGTAQFVRKWYATHGNLQFCSNFTKVGGLGDLTTSAAASEILKNKWTKLPRIMFRGGISTMNSKVIFYGCLQITRISAATDRFNHGRGCPETSSNKNINSNRTSKSDRSDKDYV